MSQFSTRNPYQMGKEAYADGLSPIAPPTTIFITEVQREFRRGWIAAMNDETSRRNKAEFFVVMEVPMNWYDDTNFGDLGAQAYARGLNRYAYPGNLTEEQQSEFRQGWLRAKQANLTDIEEARRCLAREQFQYFNPYQETFNDV